MGREAEPGRDRARRQSFHDQRQSRAVPNLLVSPPTLAGQQVRDRSALALIMKRLAAGPITPRLRLTAHTRTRFITARKTWSLRFACAAMTAAPPMVPQFRPTPRNAAGCMGTEKSRRTVPFTFLTTTALAVV